MNTEDEAKTKWCPFARVINITGQGGGNRWDKSGDPFYLPSNSLCIASECMAWRVERGDAESDGAGNWLPVGYCGLAGKP